MTEPHARSVLDEAPPNNSPTEDGSMAELRSLLLGPAEAQLAEIHERLTDPRRQTEEVSRVLPEAVRLRTQQDHEVTEALLPTVEEAIGISVRKDPQVLVDAIFPVMGPAIRKAISAALNGMIQSLNQTLAHGFSIRGLKWRLEAIRTGKSFAEVVLLHTLLYRVEQVFLIHRETGLMLQHVVAGTGVVQDADMVSGMLTAIQDFVHDSFSTSKEDALDTLRVGELTVWIERGPLAVLAGVIWGNAPQSLRSTFQDTLDTIHVRYNKELKEFDGDATPLEPSRPLLEACLQFQYDTEKEAAEKKRRLSLLMIILGIVVIALLLFTFFYLRNAWRWEDYVERLKNQPGIVVTNAEKRWGKYYISGLRDPLAADPQAIMREAKVDPEDVISRWEPYQALSTEFVLARAKALLEPPATVTMRVENNILYAEGSAPHQWIVETQRLARFIPGINGFNRDKLIDTEQIEKQFIRFELNETTLVPGQDEKMDQLIAGIEKLCSVAQAVRKSVRIEIIGHTDRSGTEARNSKLSQERADKILSDLAPKLATLPNLKMVSIGSRDTVREERTEEDRSFNRSVSFRVTLQ